MSDTMSLLDWRPQVMGETFNQERDKARLCAQALRVFDLMKDGQWRTLPEIAGMTGDPTPSVSARLRQIRGAGHTVEREHVSNGLWKYRVLKGENL